MTHKKKFIEVNGYRMAYVESGAGDPIVFLHGNPTSSFLWRNIIPHCESLGRCIAPDLIGMGDSDKLNNSGPNSYSVKEHADFLEGLLEQLGVQKNVVLVIHDWGSALGADWARRHPEAVQGIAILEAIIPYTLSWQDMGDQNVQAFFRALRSSEGESMILEDNLWIEQNLPSQISRHLSEEEMSEYRRPFIEPGEGRRSMLTLARSVPIDGEPADVSTLLELAHVWLSSTSFPKLLLDGGESLMQETIRTWKNASRVDSIPGKHFLQEDSPHEIGESIAEWISQKIRT